MFSWIGRRVSYANVAMTLALVFAMGGGAFAASHNGPAHAAAHHQRYVITSAKQISPGVLKALKGSPGSAGARGETGSAGSTGAPGAQGKEGPAGPKGDTGPKGETGAAGAKGDTGPAGPQGNTGPTGPEGSPWTATGTLPSGKTEKGAWAAGQLHTGESDAVAISFPIPLASAVTANNVTSEEEELGEVPAGCTVEGVSGSFYDPIAAAGNFCVYSGSTTSAQIFETANAETAPLERKKAGKVGVLLFLEVTGEQASARGDWAVTAP